MSLAKLLKRNALFLLLIGSLSSCAMFAPKHQVAHRPSKPRTTTTRPKPPSPKPRPPRPAETKPAPTGTAAKEVQLRNDMVAFSKRYLGTPYKYAGKNPSTGFDCSGFTCYVYRQFGMNLGSASRYQAQEGRKISAKDAKPGDLIIFGNQGKINHVGMVVEVKNSGIHVIHSTSRGVVIDNITTSSYWKPRIMYGRRIVGN